MEKILFVDVDTLEDFMLDSGSLYVEGAESIIPVLSELTGYSKTQNITTLKVEDLHDKNSPEISNNPDFKTTFPPHTMIYTAGAASIVATERQHLSVISSRYVETTVCKSLDKYNCVGIKKDTFDMWQEDYAEEVVNIINPTTVVVYGVCTNICVDLAARGFAARGYPTIVVTDAVKELPGCDVPKLMKEWSKIKNLYTLPSVAILNGGKPWITQKSPNN
jgi:nicotinamidase/pyrazinamidase